MDAFENKITTIYGHNMRNSIMFSELGKYLDEKFFNSHKEFIIYTPNENYKANVFSCYSIGINDEENNIKDLEFDEEIKYYKTNSKFQNENVINVEKIIKLCTCSYLNNKRIPTEKRYFIIANLEKLQ